MSKRTQAPEAPVETTAEAEDMHTPNVDPASPGAGESVPDNRSEMGTEDPEIVGGDDLDEDENQDDDHGDPETADDPEELTNAERATVGLSGYEARLTVVALEHRQAALKKLAKKTKDEGYWKEARIVTGDAQAIKEHILPQFRPQVELPLHTPEECRTGIANAIRSNLAGALEREYQAGRTSAQIDQGKDIPVRHRASLETLMSELAHQIETFGRAVADRAYAAGHAAREQTAEAVMVRSLDALRFGTSNDEDE